MVGAESVMGTTVRGWEKFDLVKVTTMGDGQRLTYPREQSWKDRKSLTC